MDEFIKTFFKLVSIYSPSGDEKLLTDHIISNYKNYFDLIRKDRYGNIYAQIKGVGTPIFFSAHLDTVEPGKNIRPSIKNGNLVSDGKTILGADNKVAVACFIEIARLLKNKKKHKPLEFIFTKSEETGNYGAINFDYSLLKAKIGYCFDTVSPVGTIITASPYYERFDLTLMGRSAHASKPEEAKNALLVLNSLLSNLKFGKVNSDTLFNIGLISGGSVRNTIPGEIILHGEIRSFSEKNIEKVRNNLVKQLKRISLKAKTRYKVDFVRENPGYKFTNASIKHLIEAIAAKMQTNGIRPKVQESWGVSDANIFNQKKLICINLGDGVENAHTVNERIKIKDLEKNLNLILSLIKND